FWRRALHDGMVPNTALPAKTVAIQGPGASTGSEPQTSGSGLDIVFRADPSVYDGRFANNGWLQELPKPLTKLTWDNTVLISPATAKRYGIGYEIQWKGGNADSDVVELTYQGRTVRGPVWVLPGHPDDTVTVHLGYGRTRAGKVADGQGFDAYKLRTSNAPWFGTGVEMRKTGETYPLAVTQLHHNMEGRDIARSGTLLEYLRDPNATSAGENLAHAAREHSEGHHGDEPPPSFYPEWKYEKEWYAWGMAIDVNACVGCNACVVACQSENNIPVVGKEQVMRGREMHWLRVDSYYTGEENNVEGPLFMPIVCMHCELAPCEPVCPVVATVHDDEGLNLQVYNRCIGVRYCSNNCPYKVRRFNFFLYQDWDTPQYKLMRNPEVSVRSRGVMEKCTYCVQRIQWGKIEAGKENRRIRDGEVVTACQAVCPTEAIVFGDINDPESRVTKLKKLERNYSLLGELGTRPRTTYLSAMRNPNPEIKAETHGTEERTRHE
ncbi:MAG: 4Fe-4S dicluster domain-containing protein, partial [Pyrinomonadaceae bacterium]|nr:4Fe-4S dicluster domain-containing protein [Pyrinomonadaceae bacterium]